jgi:hypothetical protein
MAPASALTPYDPEPIVSADDATHQAVNVNFIARLWIGVGIARNHFFFAFAPRTFAEGSFATSGCDCSGVSSSDLLPNPCGLTPSNFLDHFRGLPLLSRITIGG